MILFEYRSFVKHNGLCLQMVTGSNGSTIALRCNSNEHPDTFCACPVKTNEHRRADCACTVKSTHARSTLNCINYVKMRPTQIRRIIGLPYKRMFGLIRIRS
jgi:hypothetical protein